jgi:hypothetical protein
MPIKRLIFLSTVLAVTVLSGCLYESREALGTLGVFEPDERIIGSWEALEIEEVGQPDSRDYFELDIMESDGWLGITVTTGELGPYDRRVNEDQLLLRAFPTMIGDEMIYNVLEPDSEDGPVWTFFRVEFHEGFMHLSAFDCPDGTDAGCDPVDPAQAEKDLIAGLDNPELWTQPMVLARR